MNYFSLKLSVDFDLDLVFILQCSRDGFQDFFEFFSSFQKSVTKREILANLRIGNFNFTKD